MGKVLPDAGVSAIGSVPPRLSVAEAENVTTAPEGPVASTVRLLGNVITGGVRPDMDVGVGDGVGVGLGVGVGVGVGVAVGVGVGDGVGVGAGEGVGVGLGVGEGVGVGVGVGANGSKRYTFASLPSAAICPASFMALASVSVTLMGKPLTTELRSTIWPLL